MAKKVHEVIAILQSRGWQQRASGGAIATSSIPTTSRWSQWLAD